MTWMQVDRHLENDDRAIVPLGSTEQHAYLSLSTDSILATRVAEEVGEACRAVVFPCLSYGMTPLYQAYPGTVSLSPSTYFAVIGDVLGSLHKHGFRRFFLVNGHGGNAPVQSFISQWLSENEDSEVVLYNWWCAPKTLQEVHAVDPVATHASWMERFESTKVDGVILPPSAKPVVDYAKLKQLAPSAIRTLLGDGSYGGAYEKSDEIMERIWRAAIDEAIATFNTAWSMTGNCRSRNV